MEHVALIASAEAQLHYEVSVPIADVPAELVPDSWPGHDALALTATIYRAMAETSEAHLDAHLGTATVDHSTRFAA